MLSACALHNMAGSSWLCMHACIARQSCNHMTQEAEAAKAHIAARAGATGAAFQRQCDEMRSAGCACRVSGRLPLLLSTQAAEQAGQANSRSVLVWQPQGHASCRVPLLDEFLITLQNIVSAPDVHAALSAGSAAAPQLPSSATAPEPAPARLQRPPSTAGAQRQSRPVGHNASAAAAAMLTAAASASMGGSVREKQGLLPCCMQAQGMPCAPS